MERKSNLVWILSVLVAFAAVFPQGSFADLTYEASCSLNDSSNPCSPDEGLLCINGQCLCPSELSYHFNQTIKRCVGLVGTACQLTHGSNSSSICHPDYAVCAPDSASATGNSCACADLHSPNFHRLCFRSEIIRL
jgi:hypothetical protein